MVTFKRNNPRKRGKNKLSKSKSSKSGMYKLNDLDEMIKGINDFYKDNKVLCHKVFTESKEVTGFRNKLLGKKTRHSVGGGSDPGPGIRPGELYVDSPIHGPDNDPDRHNNLILMFLGLLFIMVLCIRECIVTQTEHGQSQTVINRRRRVLAQRSHNCFTDILEIIIGIPYSGILREQLISSSSD